MRIAIILYCLLSAIINVSAAENVTPGKYFCVVSDASIDRFDIAH